MSRQRAFSNSLSRIMDRLQPHIRCLKPYVSARLNSDVGELNSSILLNANENPYPPPAKLTVCPDKVWDSEGYNYYPEPQPQELLKSLAQFYGVDSSGVLVGRGSDEAIDLLVRAFCAKRDSLVICSPTFGMYRSYAEIQGCGIIDLPLEIRPVELDGAEMKAERGAAQLCEARLPLETLRWQIEHEAPKLLFLPSPQAPTGSLIPQEELRDLLRCCATYDVLLVIDEAYAEFARRLEPQHYRSLIPLLDEYPNLVILRTLSKSCGLAGERIGCLLAAAPLLQVLRSIQAPYPMPGSISRYVSAMLQDQKALARIDRQLSALCAEQRKLFSFLQNLPYIESIFCSAANFIMVQIAQNQASELWRHCRRHAIILRDFSGEMLPSALRISVGSKQQMEALRSVLQNFALT